MLQWDKWMCDVHSFYKYTKFWQYITVENNNICKYFNWLLAVDSNQTFNSGDFY